MLQPISRPGLVEPGSDLDVAIVGAGAAGIAAARRCLAAGARTGVFEARDRVGGRAVTASFGGHPVDLGAHWMHAGALNPLLGLAVRRGEPVRRAPPKGGLMIDGRVATRAEHATQRDGFERVDRAITRGARNGPDRSIASLFPPLGRWREPTAATFALVSGRPLAEVSAADFPSEEFGDNYFVRGGYGALLARFAAGLPVALGCPVEAVRTDGATVAVETGRGTVTARAVVVALPIPVLATGGCLFRPGLPVRWQEAIAAFLPATYEHVIINWPDSPFRHPDRLVKLVGRHGSVGMMTCMDGAPFHYLELGHEDLERIGGNRAGRPAAFARAVLAEQFGRRASGRARILAVTDWVRDPRARGAWAVVRPGRASDRETLCESPDGRIWFAGEANVRSQWGTVGGAWSAGEAAAREALGTIGLRDPAGPLTPPADPFEPAAS